MEAWVTALSDPLPSRGTADHTVRGRPFHPLLSPERGVALFLRSVPLAVPRRGGMGGARIDDRDRGDLQPRCRALGPGTAAGRAAPLTDPRLAPLRGDALHPDRD